jgi:hypothetical protein
MPNQPTNEKRRSRNNPQLKALFTDPNLHKQTELEVLDAYLGYAGSFSNYMGAKTVKQPAQALNAQTK